MPLIAQGGNAYDYPVYGKCDPIYFGFPGNRIIDVTEFIAADIPTPPSGVYIGCIWTAVMNITLSATPTQYQGIYSKYQIGNWAQLSRGVLIAEGFLNYTVQRICSGICNINNDTFEDYNGIGYNVPPLVGDVEFFVSPLNQYLTNNGNLIQPIASDGFAIGSQLTQGEGTIDLYYFSVASPENWIENTYGITLI